MRRQRRNARPRNRSPEQRGSETERPIRTHPTHSILIALALSATVAGWVAAGRAEPSPLDARVLWWRAGRVYLAASDSSVVPGTHLTFLSRGRTIGTGTIERIVDGELVVARLDTGSLASEKKLEKIGVLAEPPALPRLPVLRVGYPASGRSAPWWGCRPTTLRPPTPLEVSVADGSNDRSWRWVRTTSVRVLPEHWPDTVVVRLFDEAADEEIALERGEIDAAVFWPGELSTHMRERPEFPGPFLVPTSWRLAATGLAAGDSMALGALNRDLFRGDLLPLTWSAPASSQPARFEVDAQSQDRIRLPRPGGATPGGARPVRLSVVAVHTSVPQDDPAPVPIFAMRCAIVAAPPLRPLVTALGPWLVDAVQCVR